MYANHPETRTMNHIEIDEFLAERFQVYKEQGMNDNIIKRLYDKFISWLNLLLNNKKSVSSLFRDIHNGRYNANVDYSKATYTRAVEKYNREVAKKD